MQFFFLTQYVQKDPGPIVGPIASILGYIMDFFFNIAYIFSENNSLGMSIIFLTIATRIIMFPLSVKSQKSMAGMQALQPEVIKIREKYGTSKDPEIQQKMNAEIQTLYSNHKINPFGGCLPLIIQMPIFFALSYIMQQSQLYIGKLGGVYNSMAEIVLQIPGRFGILQDFAFEKVPKALRDFDMSSTHNLTKLLSKFTESDWSMFFAEIPANYVEQLTPMLQQKENIEHFLGINLVANSGWGFPGIMIPVLAALTTFLSSWILQRQQSTPTDSNAKMTQQIMLIVMPFFMGYMTVSLPAGVGIYWITSNFFQVFQQLALSHLFKKKS